MSMAIAVPTRLLEELMDAVTVRLMGEPFFADVAVLAEQYSSTSDKDGNVISEVEDIEVRVLNALGVLNERGGKNGACIVVMMPEVTEAERAHQGGLLATVEVRVRYLCNPLFNNNATSGTRKSEGQLAIQGACLLHRFDPFGLLASPLALDKAPLRPINADLPEGVNGYETVHSLRIGVSAGAMVAAPQATIVGDMVTLTCSTDDAEIRYTINGGPAGAGNPAALVYSAPFAAEDGDLVRASASAPGKVESNPLHVFVVIEGTSGASRLLRPDGYRVLRPDGSSIFRP